MKRITQTQAIKMADAVFANVFGPDAAVEINLTKKEAGKFVPYSKPVKQNDDFVADKQFTFALSRRFQGDPRRVVFELDICGYHRADVILHDHVGLAASYPESIECDADFDWRCKCCDAETFDTCSC